jgi:CrcB protein
VGLIITTKKIPIATFSVNIFGSFLIGLLMGYIIKQSNAQTCQLLLVTGFCGGFTTFSTFSWDIIVMLQQQLYSTALFYITATVLCSVVFTFLGLELARYLN